MLRGLLGGKDEDDIVVAQVEAFKRRVPILYLILAVNTALMAVTRFGQQPFLITAVFPAVLVTIMLIRAVKWRRLRHVEFGAVVARKIIRSTTILAVLLSVAVLAWACLMYRMAEGSVSSGVTEAGQTTLYIALTVVCCATLLMHVRAAAMLVTLVVLVPFCLFLGWAGTFVERAVAVNIAVVTLGIVYVTSVFAQDFANLVSAKQRLIEGTSHQTKLANTDLLTGLSNRRAFFVALEAQCSSSTAFSLIIIDLDGFGHVNDLHGHLVGDEVLRLTATRISHADPTLGSLFRLGGDEFALICPGIDRVALVERTRRLLAACEVPIVLNDAKFGLGASAGVVVVTKADLLAPYSQHLERADYALSHAKQAGKGRVTLFALEHETSIRRERLVEQTLRQADLVEELFVVFQPIVNAGDGSLRGCEALARWKSPHLGLVPPSEFIPIAERGNFVHSVTAVMLEKALKEAGDWTPNLRLKVNLSGRDMMDRTQMLRLLSILKASAISPERITFELTETALAGDIDAVVEAAALLRSYGSSLAIDDFGTGYSSLSYIHRLSPNLIKIDRSFVNRIGTGDDVESVIKTIVELCRNLGARSLAEGVETEDQFQVLKTMKVDEIQGYYVSKPIHPGELLACIAQKGGSRSHRALDRPFQQKASRNSVQ